MSKLSKWVKRGGRVFAGALLCGSIMFGTAAAEEASAIDGMAAFREAISAPAQQDQRVFHQDLQFFVPAIRADMGMTGYTKGHNLKMSGDVELFFIGDDGKTAEMKVPFFIDQKKKEMTLYFKPGQKWFKFQTPTLAAAATDGIATPDENDVEDIISSVKSVTVLRETDTQRTMLVQIDNEKLADLIAGYGKQNPPDKGTADDAVVHNAIMDCLEKGIRRANIWYTWTVDKATWKTVTMSYNLSSMVQETARVALEQPHEWPKELDEFLQRIAYYSDMKTYTIFLNKEAKKLVVLPEEARFAEAVEDVFADGATSVTVPAK